MQVSLHRGTVRAAIALSIVTAATWDGFRTTAVLAEDQFAKPSTLSSGELSADEFQQLSQLLRLPDQPWSRIHWHSSLTEARLQAQKERKPLLIRASYGTLHGVC